MTDRWSRRSRNNMRHRVKTIVGGRPLALLLFASLLAGCEVGPDYSRPKVEQPAAFKSQSATRPAQPLPTDWWRLYRDPRLDQLIATANESNQSLRQAVARVDQARALAHISASFLLPTV